MEANTVKANKITEFEKIFEELNLIRMKNEDLANRIYNKSNRLTMKDSGTGDDEELSETKRQESIIDIIYHFMKGIRKTQSILSIAAEQLEEVIP